MNYHKIISKLSDKIIIPNWFTKNQLEDVMQGETITTRQYKEFIDYVKDSYLMDDISDRIRELYQSYRGGK